METTPTHIVANSIMILKDLEDDTYENWKACMMTYLEAQDLWDVIGRGSEEAETKRKKEGAETKEWRRKDAAALLAIQTSCAPEILARIRSIRSAKRAWDTLAEMKEQELEQDYSSEEEEEEESSEEEEEEEDVNYEELLPQDLLFSVDDVPLLSKDWTVEDYQYWSYQMKTYLSDRGLWDGTVEFTVQPDGAPPIVYKTWREKNFIALRAIQASFGADIPYQISGVTSAKIAWDILANLNQFKKRAIPPNDTLYKAPLSELNPGARRRETQYYRPLVAAINNGDWDSVKGFLDWDHTALTAVINRQGELPIHAAIRGKQWNITRELIDLMSEKELELQTSKGATALHFASWAQHIRIVECLIQKNERLVQLKGKTQVGYPVTMAGLVSNEETTRHIYNRTPIQLLFPECGNDGFLLFKASIYNEMFGLVESYLYKIDDYTMPLIWA
ncbi:hypothetical protein Tsubulata_019652 [Turnera subulata]|uniref:DUF4219 domain-containing protein n=1 Tax=Turnera subulata TaxID=218843 RepID=A0A9Q0FPC7_9ROSI|nr:hypothetical protein Tsubulata_019652 [Turnera subulata]